MSAATSSAELLEGILKGQVPRQVRLFAAQGLLPITREELLHLQVVLSSDPDPQLAEIAATSLRDADTDTVVKWLGDASLGPLELDLLIRVRRDEPVWAAVAKHSGASNSTLRVLARNGSALVQDIIITNQVRVLDCLEILEDLRSNPQVSQVVLRRVREFEEEFIVKLTSQLEQLEAPQVEEVQQPLPSIDDALAALRAIGARIPAEEEFPFPVFGDPSLADAIDRAGGGAAFDRLTKMNVKDQIMAALKGSKEERGILIYSRNRLVMRSVLESPKLSDTEVAQFASSRSIDLEALRIISSTPRWLRKYGIVVALVENPKTPIRTAMTLCGQLQARDLRRLAQDRNANPVVSRQAKNWLERKR